MHRRFALAALVAAFAVPAAAQSTRGAGTTHVEFLAGMTSAWLSIDGASTGSLRGTSFGGAVEHEYSRRLASRVELHFLEKGGLERVPTGKIGVDMRSIELPVLAVVSFGQSATLNPHIAFGPSMSYLLSCESGSQGSSGTIFVGACTGAINRTDAALVGGAGLDIRGHGFSWGMHARYHHGLRDISKGPADVNSRLFQFLFSFAY